MQTLSEAPSAHAGSRRATPRAALDRAVGTVREAARAFARLPISAKIDLLKTTQHSLARVMHAWVRRGCEAKGLATEGRETAEEWLGGPVPSVRNVRLILESLAQIARDGRPAFGHGSRVRRDGRIEVDVLPTGRYDAVLLAGFGCRVLLEPGLDEWTARQRQASFYQVKEPDGRVSLVLGAGNVSSIPVMDVVHKMFVEGRACVLKMNPVNEWVGPFLEQGLSALIAPGYLQVVYGGADEGEYLCQHPGIDDIHITGSNKTHDRIVWGPPGPEHDRRRRANEPILKKSITSELGNVSPVAIVPADYSEEELWFQARNVATMVVNNASFNCNAAKLLVLAKGWSQKGRFLDFLGKALSEARPRKAYYPGAKDRYAELLHGRTNVKTFGQAGADTLAWALVTDLDPQSTTESLFHVEPFCGLLSQTDLVAEDPVAFLAAATKFCNERVWGTLNAMLVIHPKTEADPEVAKALERAIVDLRYGTVSINHWPAVVYAAASPPWGGHPSATLADIQSGRGFVHNTFMLEGIEKAVLRGPLTLFPKPAWFYDHAASHVIGERLAHFEAAPSPFKLPALAAAALRG
jgi:aldehyde dehydrogenase (NAD(P)+)